MGALIRGWRLLLTGLSKLRGLLIAVLGNANVQGWGVAIVVAVSYIAIWKSVIEAGYDFLASMLSSYTVQIFGAGSIPLDAIWLINQTFPVALFFKLTAGLIAFRIGVSVALSVAITASRKLK